MTGGRNDGTGPGLDPISAASAMMAGQIHGDTARVFSRPVRGTALEPESAVEKDVAGESRWPRP